MSKSFPTPSKTFFILFFLHLFLSLVLRLTGQLEQRIFNEILIYGALAYSMMDPNGTMIQVISRHLQYSSFYTFFPYIPFKTSVTMGFLPLKQSNGVQPYLPFFLHGDSYPIP